MPARTSSVTLLLTAVLIALAVRTVAVPLSRAAAQAGAWQSYGCADCVVSVAAAPDAVWAGTMGAGVVRHDLRDGTWRRYGRADGLDGDTVRELAVGPDGDVWAIVFTGNSLLTTRASVAHFDGTRWTTYGAAAGAWIPKLRDASLAAGPAGTALIGIRDGPGNAVGIGRFDGTNWHVDGPAEGVAGFVSAVAFGPDGRGWAVSDGSLLRLDAGQWLPMPTDSGVAFAAKSLAVGADGTVIIASGRDLWRYREAGWRDGRHLRRDAVVIAPEAWVRVQADTGGAAAWLLIASDGRFSAYRLEDERWRRMVIPAFEPLPDGSSSTVDAVVGSDGRVWSGRLKGGLTFWDGAKHARRLTEDGPSAVTVVAVTVGPNGHIWTGNGGVWGRDNTLNAFDGRRWQRHDRREGVPSATTLLGLARGGVEVAPDGDVWLNLEDAVARFDGRAWKRFTVRDGLPNGAVNDLAADGHGGAWAATAAGVGHFDGLWWRTVAAAGAAVPGHVTTVAVDRRASPEVVWIGGTGAAARFDGTSWQRFAEAEGVPIGTQLLDAAIDANGNVWFSTGEGLVLRCDAAACASVGPTDGMLVGVAAWAIALDAYGRPWLAGASNAPASGGLFHFDGQRWVRFSMDDGLIENWAYDVAVDATGRVWVATLGGVSVFTPPDAPLTRAPSATPAPIAAPIE